LIAEVLTKKLAELPKITQAELSPNMLCLKRLMWFYEETTVQRARLKNQLHKLLRGQQLSTQSEETAVLSFIIKAKQSELERIAKTQSAIKTKLTRLLTTEGENLMTIPGVGVVLAAQVVAHTNGVARFATSDKFLQYAGIGPLEKSSGKKKRFTQNNKGNRMLNHALYMIALNRITRHLLSKAYYEKKVKEGKTKKHALRCLMRRVGCVIYGMLKNGKDYKEQS
jgi:transposase